MNRLLSLLVVGLGLLVACQSTTSRARLTWYKAAASQRQFAQDRYRCMRETGGDTPRRGLSAFARGLQSAGESMQGKPDPFLEQDRRDKFFVACMESRGYSLEGED